MSSTNGVEILPSGRTATFIESSGFRQTMMLMTSSGPMR
jgi:hypothetical protein